MNKFLLFMAAAAISVPAFAADGSLLVDEQTHLVYRVISEDEATLSLERIQVGTNPTTLDLTSEVTINDKTYTVVKIERDAFDELPTLTSVSIPSSVISIGENAFAKNESLSRVTFSEGLQEIGANAFQNCPVLNAVTLPASLTKMGTNPFRGCYSLINIRLADGNTAFFCDAGVIYDSDMETLVAFPSGKKNTFAILETCTTILPYAIADATISDVIFPYGLTTIGDYALSGSALKKVNYPSKVTSMGSYVFSNCEDLTQINLDGCKNLAAGTFSGCTSLEEVTIAEGVESIGDNAFAKCTNLKSINLPASLKTMGTTPLAGCTALEAINVAEDSKQYTSLDGVLYTEDFGTLLMCPAGKTGSYTISDETTRIDTNSFRGCSKITEVIMGSDVLQVGISAFQECTALEKVTFSPRLNLLGLYSFASCTALKEIELPSSLTEVSAGAFMMNTSLEKVVLSSSTQEIFSNTFMYCTSLKEVYCLAETAPKLDDTSFAGIANGAILYVPAEAKASYEKEANWTDAFSEIKELAELQVTISPEEVTIEAGKTYQLTINAVSENDMVKVVTTSWRCNNAAVAKVDNNGLVTAIAPGNATITATITDNTNNSHIVKCQVTVSEDGAVDAIIIDDAPVCIYTISGVYVSDSFEGLARGIYIVKQGNRVIKHVVK